MAILTKEQIMQHLQDKLSTDDADLEFLEQLSDTLDANETTNKDNEDWKKKYEENDKSWRERYKARFLEPSQKTNTNDGISKEIEKELDYESTSEGITIADLFE